MKVFLDTNIFLEYLQRRRRYQAVSQLLSAVEDKRIKAVVSAGCVYTLAYLIRMELKRQGIHRPEQTNRLRSLLNIVLSMGTVASISHKRMVSGTNDLAFDDVEDSYQYQCALQNKCDALVTINLKDYRLADTSAMEILLPDTFVSKYL
ncbi:MAG: PIN domain-containing protein [Prevotella sp.]|nr:PIN domain-containing protein [Prevotella sp.]MBQ9186525.1 PIN domain-containing protein [Prevotella sp.]